MSIYEDFERDSADAAKYVNEDGLVISRYGPQPKKTWLYLQSEFEKSIPFTKAGDFSAGFTYESTNQTGLDSNGDYWIYNGTVPFTVAPGTVPSEPDYTKVIFNLAENIQSNDGTVQSDLDLAKDHREATADAHPAVAISDEDGISLQESLTKILRNKPQISAIEQLSNSSPAGEMYLRTTSTEVFVGVSFGAPYYLNNDSSDYQTAVEWRFTKNDDNLLLFRGCRSGFLDVVTESNPITTSGTFLGGAPVVYTLTVGDKFSGTVNGRALVFRHNSDNRGGVWKFTITSDNVQKEKLISTWSENAPGTNLVFTTVFDDLNENETLSYEAEFIGDDPNNEPSTGAGNSRGWLFYDDSASQYPVYTYKYNGLSDAVNISATQTINDFAIQARPTGASYSSEWVPQHGSVNNVSKNVTTRMYVDDERYDVTSSIPSIEIKKISKFKIQSFFNAQNPNDDGLFLWDHFITHSIVDGVLQIDNHVSFTDNTRVSVGYLAMLGADVSRLGNVIFTDGNEFPTSNTPSEFTQKYATRGVIYSGFLDESLGVSHAICAETDIFSACNLKGESSDSANRQTFRSDNVNKTYWTAAEGEDFSSGDFLRSSTKYYAVSGLRYPNTINN